MLGFGAVTLILAFCWLPVLALVRRLRRTQPHPRWAQAARAVAWLTGGLATAFTIGFVTMTSDGNAFSEAIVLGSTSLTTLLVLNGIAVATTTAMVASTVAAWAKGWWTITGRVAYMITTLAAISFLTVAFVYNLVGPPITIS